MINESPFFLVVGLFVVGGSWEEAGLSAWFLPLFPFVGGILVRYVWGILSLKADMYRRLLLCSNSYFTVFFCFLGRGKVR